MNCFGGLTLVVQSHTIMFAGKARMGTQTTPTNQNTPTNLILGGESNRRMGPGTPYKTSCRLNWSGVEVHRYRVGPSETPEHSYPTLTVFLSHVDQPVNGEVRLSGTRIKGQLGNNTISIAPPGLRLSARRDGSGEVTVIFFDQAVIGEIARAATGVDNPEVLPQYAIQDPLARALGDGLDAELNAEHPGPRIYAESLGAALAAHIFAKYTDPASRELSHSTLNRAQLRRSVEYINEHLDQDVSLAQLADVANMSKYHFAKSFRQAMGIAPHQYLVKLRVEKARKLLANDRFSVEEVANAVGYADKGHFAAQFSKVTGTTPHRYRARR
jgi:AraC family transcriptional regulator